MSASGQPVIILKEGSGESRGREAQRNNVAAAKLIAEVVRTSLGPRGMDKMLVDSMGDVTITNDGATMLKELDVQHPAAKMMVEISKATDNEVGDGTTSAVVVAGALLEKAEDLISKDVHPVVVVDGYGRAAEKAQEILEDIAEKVNPESKADLLKIANTSMMTKLVSEDSPHLAGIVVDAVLQVAEKKEGGFKVDIDNVKVEKKPGGALTDTAMVKGIILDKEVVHSGMPKRIDEAKIALVNSALEIEKTEFSAEIRINDPQQMQQFMDEETSILKGMVDKVHSAGANVLICQKGIDDLAQHFLAKDGILTVRRVKESDMTKLAKATGARIVTNLDDLNVKDLGYAKLVEERKLEDDKWVFVEGAKNPKAVSILVRGGTQRVVDEAERALHDALMVTKDVVELPAVVAGGGAPEEEVSIQLRSWAQKLSGREQLAALKFADAMESIPLTLAENAGMDPIDTQVDLRAKHGKEGKWYGVDALNGKVADMYSRSVWEPLAVKLQILRAATEAASMILRIDDVIAASKMKAPPSPPGGGMGGMGGMPPM
ncbi:MAG: TCP-1/cpn60 chaperonin family protein [Nitrososphaerota archaeon]|jgi:thermosome|nr:TCP-1/cpn60 chaperonin family protein [Nitrososphaerota archaeon]MDG6942177.1 TCP-1/cpn60 chaperonin family protein [Nitrososphaerota archaeon]MDG6942642.1 TCP-1/cpn60 chaperonin family protein [Nitrososphaerota archaeon]MDG6948429.1 TCP-1/cpn60 chaperonin family protein [Nitrososphaerota archaeon]MDG6950355.1 TCP-1/cpn60 chaperonin family protein [Nitrososphaerota archaeon]